MQYVDKHIGVLASYKITHWMQLQLFFDKDNDEQQHLPYLDTNNRAGHLNADNMLLQSVLEQHCNSSRGSAAAVQQD